MNEEDYEINKPQVPGRKIKSDEHVIAGLKRSWSGELWSSKRPRGDFSTVEGLDKTVSDPSNVAEIDLEEQRIASGSSRTKKAELEPIEGGDIGNISHGVVTLKSPKRAEIVTNESANGTDMDVDQEQKDESAEQEAKKVIEVDYGKIDEEARRYLAQQSSEVVIPSYSAWFDMTAIHDIEKKALPEFFNNKNKSKTPTIYKDYRDFMINTYRLNPSEYLTVTACRRNLAGDVCAIIRVHAFLEQWGLINYQVDSESRPSHIGPPFTGHFRITADTPRGLQPFLPAVVPQSSLASSASGTVGASQPPPSTVPKASESVGKIDPNLALRKDVYSKPSTTAQLLISESTIEKKQFTCFTCGVDCTRSRYHSLKTPNFEVCPNCYVEGRFPSTMYSGDFLRLESTPSSSGNEWTDQETLLLLEAIEMYDDDWSAVSSHVGTKTREQCILHFLQLPIEDPYLGTNGSKISDLGPLQYQHVPFNESENPVMSLVAFLSSVVNPGVASEAAKAALKELTAAGNVNKDSNGVAMEKSKEKGKENDMEVDAGSPAKPTGTGSSVPNGVSPTHQPQLTPIQKAAQLALTAASSKASAIASYEESQMRSLVTEIVELQMKKIELKLKQFEEMESMLENEKVELEKARAGLVRDRLELKKSVERLQNVAATISGTGGTPAMIQQSKIMEGVVGVSPLPVNTSNGGAKQTYQKDANAVFTTLP
ncbi:SWIRM domain-containing protein [Paraphysoderma sedebokerense]|nr:SWIRM domain-containing protein [Paraphysoderma sedebokerense]